MRSVKQLHLRFQYPKDSWPGFPGKKPSRDWVDEIVEEDADVYTPEGEILFMFRKAIINASATKQALPILRGLGLKTNNRGVATGNFAKLGWTQGIVKEDGTMSNTNRAPAGFEIESGVIGSFDRYPRIPYCRQTQWTMDNPEKFAQVIPFLQSATGAYAAAAPERFKLQAERNAKTNPDWIIPGTAFTTITVNRNWPTAVHTDKGDFKAGLSCITALRSGEFRGGELIFPHYRVGVSLETCDLLMFDSHHMHGNLPMIGKVGEWERVSLVMYVREKQHRCLSALGEVDRAKNRQKGSPLWD